MLTILVFLAKLAFDFPLTPPKKTSISLEIPYGEPPTFLPENKYGEEDRTKHLDNVSLGSWLSGKETEDDDDGWGGVGYFGWVPDSI